MSSFEKTGKLTIVTGPMFAGKTTWLLSFARSQPEGGFVVFKPTIDIRFSLDHCVTHDGDKLPSMHLQTESPSFPELGDDIKTILIDELNFFAIDTLLPQIKKQLSKGRNVVGVGLLYDYLKQPFGATLPLSKVADTVITLFAICDKCGEKAEHVYRKDKSTQTIILGAKELYGASCVACWDALNSSNHLSKL